MIYNASDVLVEFELTFCVLSRCMAHKNDLDGSDCIYRCQELTEKLVEEYELGELWGECGIIGDIVVSCSFS